MTRIFAALLALAAMACQPALAATEANPPLWKVADADTTIYLFGTIHALPEDVRWYRGMVPVALESAVENVSEIGDTPRAELQEAVLRHGALPRGQSLRDLMKPEDRTRYEAALARLDLPSSAFDGAKPWFAAVSLTMNALAKDGIRGRQGVEPFLLARARALGQRPVALETVDYQFAQFDSLSPEVQSRYLMDVVDHLGEIGGALREIVLAWQEGRAEDLARLMNEDEDDPQVAAALLYQRNRNWADWIRTRLDKPGVVFIAVGAGHLAGPGSVQDELAARGITAQRVQ